jgi:uncharacterized repeat protein (TIGR01451 family)
VAVGPDGALYFTSWNGFGPGSIYRIGRVTLEKAVSQRIAQPGQRLTYTLRVTGVAATQTFTVTDRIPEALTFVPGSITATTGTLTVRRDEGQLTWVGTFRRGADIRASYAVTVTPHIELSYLVENEATLHIAGTQMEARAWTLVNPRQRFLPLVRR